MTKDIMENITKIYIVEKCHNDNNKVYIGKTINSREKSHKIKFGSQIIYTYIDYVNSLNREDWKPIESYWIEQFRQWGFEIMNQNKGGGGPEFVSDSVKLKISSKLHGKSKLPRTKEHCDNLSLSLKGIPKKGSGRKKGALITERDLLIRKKPRKSQSQETINNRAIKNTGKRRTQETKQKMSNAKKNKPSNNSKPVYQYDLNNNLIKKWDRVVEASLFLGIRRQGIIICATNKSKTYKNYIWKYH